MQSDDAGKGQEQGAAAVSRVLNDDDYLKQLLASMPGVDPNDPELQGTIAGLRSSLSDDSSKPADAKEEASKKESEKKDDK